MPSDSSSSPTSASSAQPPDRVAWFVLLQASVQAWLRPAIWCPLLNRVHSYREVWRTDAADATDRAALVDSVVKAVDRLNREKRFGCDWLIGSSDRQEGRVTVLNLTATCKWLDIIVIDLRRGSVTSFSTGLLPLLIPLAPLANFLAFAFPFFDFDTNRKRLTTLRESLDVPVADWSAGSVDLFQTLFY